MKRKTIKIAITPEMYGERFILFKISKRGRAFLMFTCKTKIYSFLTSKQRAEFRNSRNLLFEVKTEAFKKVFPEALI